MWRLREPADLPTTCPLEFAAGRSEHPDEGWRSPFSHSTEVAQAGYYAVTLERYKIRAELSAAPHGILRFTFPRSTESRILLDLARRIGGTSTRQYVKVVGKDAIEGWVHCTPKDGGWGNGDGQVEYTLYFRTEFSTPLDDFGVVSIDLPDGRLQGPSGLVGDYFLTDDYYDRVKKGNVMRNVSEQEGRHLVFYTQFPTRENQQVLTTTWDFQREPGRRTSQPEPGHTRLELRAGAQALLVSVESDTFLRHYWRRHRNSACDFQHCALPCHDRSSQRQ